MSESSEARAELLRAFVEHVRPALERGPYRSAMLAVAQYWADEADDAVHASVVLSERDTPFWPHECEWGEAPVPGEGCGHCSDAVESWMRAWDDNGTAISAFQAWCHEWGSQEETDAANALPFAVARLHDGVVVLEEVGTLLRGWPEIGTSAEQASFEAHCRDARACELLALVHAEPSSDDPRRVLADYLLENGDPLGEYITRSFEGGDASALLERHITTWLGPLSPHVPLATARFERGFLARCDVHVGEVSVPLVRAAEWATVEELRFLPESEQFLAATMTALRRVGPLRTAALHHLADRDWRIEELHAVLDDEHDVELLFGAKTLSSLRRLVLAGPAAPGAFAALRAQNPFSRLERAELCFGREAFGAATIRTIVSGAQPFALAVSVERFDATPAGWLFERRGDEVTVTMNGWSELATIENLQFLVREVPKNLSLRLVRSRFWSPTRADAERIAQVVDRVAADLI